MEQLAAIYQIKDLSNSHLSLGRPKMIKTITHNEMFCNQEFVCQNK